MQKQLRHTSISELIYDPASGKRILPDRATVRAREKKLFAEDLAQINEQLERKKKEEPPVVV